jgi:cysteine desulfurase
MDCIAPARFTHTRCPITHVDLESVDAVPDSHIYLDSNATTPMLPDVEEAMRPYLSDSFGNPASAHQVGRRARQALDNAREKIAALLDAHPDEVIFTSGATEANNLALFGLAGESPGLIACSLIEHPCVVEPVRELKRRGFPVDWLPVDANGKVRLEAIQADTRLVCVMAANHETGTIQPISDFGFRILDLPSRPAWHCDAAQAVGKMPVRFHEWGATTLSLSGHKFHGPRGIGALLVPRGTKLRPLLYGGHQQQGKRPGTEPTALAVGLATALELAEDERENRWAKVLQLRERLLSYLRGHAAPVVVNGPETDGLPYTLNVSFPGCRSDSQLMNLDLAGVACSTGSACSSGSLLPSPVLQAMALPSEVLHSAMRFSLSALLTESEIDEAGRRIAQVVARLRQVGRSSVI